MLRFLLMSLTGWAAMFTTGVEIALPYILRGAPRRVPGQGATGQTPVRVMSLRAKLWPHYWLGYALGALVAAHSTFVMGPVMARTDAVGIWAATLALALLVLQLSLGLMLKGEIKGSSPGGTQLRRWHFWSMFVFVGLVVIHVLRNGSLINR
ncbi:MAG TPA: hypothetical protein VL983_08015 [Terriglobales bacterium]|nr:hypothetical protein [Terriglobales bacterium]